MDIPTIDIDTLKVASFLSEVRCADFSEAAAVCLDFHYHIDGKPLIIEGDLKGEFKLKWQPINQKIRDSRIDMDYTVESGAYCLAMLVIEKLTKLKVVKQSQKRTGFDYWLGDNYQMGMQEKARLEVSGILKGTIGQVNQRLKEKVEQTKKSDNLNLPAYIVIVEFGFPRIKIRKR